MARSDLAAQKSGSNKASNLWSTGPAFPGEGRTFHESEARVEDNLMEFSTNDPLLTEELNILTQKFNEHSRASISAFPHLSFATWARLLGFIVDIEKTIVSLS